MNEITTLIQKVREQRKQLENQEKELISTLFTIQCDINDIYAEFIKLKEIKKMEDVQDKKMFVFVCVSLYCPEFIMGDRIKTTTRNKLAKVTGLSPSRISHIISEVRFLYSHYKCFKIEAEYLYNSIKRSLTS